MLPWFLLAIFNCPASPAFHDAPSSTQFQGIPLVPAFAQCPAQRQEMPPIHPALLLTHLNEDPSQNSGSSAEETPFPRGFLVGILKSEGDVSEKPGTEK